MPTHNVYDLIVKLEITKLYESFILGSSPNEVIMTREEYIKKYRIPDRVYIEKDIDIHPNYHRNKMSLDQLKEIIQAFETMQPITETAVLQAESDSLDGTFTSLRIRGFRKKTEAEIDQEIEWHRDFEKQRNAEAYKNKKQREINEKREYARLKKKYEKNND
jgi:hypothetical protein